MVILKVAWKVHRDDIGDVLDINAAGKKVAGDDDLITVFLNKPDGRASFSRREVAREHGYWIVLVLKRVIGLTDIFLLRAEDDAKVWITDLEESLQGFVWANVLNVD